MDMATTLTIWGITTFTLLVLVLIIAVIISSNKVKNK